MERVLEGTLFDTRFKFLFSGYVLYDVKDKYQMELEEILEIKGRERVEMLCYLATEMSKEAGDSRTFSPDEIARDWQMTLALDTAVRLAINKGTWRDHPSKEPTSKTLAKIQKKTGIGSLARTFILRLLLRLAFPKKKPCTPHRE